MTAPSTTGPGGRSSRSKYTRALYEKIVEGYRRSPGNHARAAEFAGVDRKTARRAWSRGWPAYPWAPPIQGALAEEQKEARSRAAAMVRAEDEQAAALAEKRREEAIRAQTEELGLRSAARSAAIAMAKATLERRDLLGKLLDRLEEQAGTMKARDLAGAIREVRTILRELPRVAAELTALGEHTRGEDRATPTVTAVTIGADYDANIDEQFADLEQGIRTFARMIELAVLPSVRPSDEPAAYTPDPIETEWRPTHSTLAAVDRLREVVAIVVGATPASRGTLHVAQLGVPYPGGGHQLGPGPIVTPPPMPGGSASTMLSGSGNGGPSGGPIGSALQGPIGSALQGPVGSAMPRDAATPAPGTHAPALLPGPIPVGLPSEQDLYGDDLDAPPPLPRALVDGAEYRAAEEARRAGEPFPAADEVEAVETVVTRTRSFTFRPARPTR